MSRSLDDTLCIPGLEEDAEVVEARGARPRAEPRRDDDPTHGSGGGGGFSSAHGAAVEPPMAQASDVVQVFTDGACQPNPGPGGWGAVVRVGGLERELSGGEPATTNNRMELTAAVRALTETPEGAVVVLTTDSTYVRDGITRWISSWKRNGWQTSAKQPVKNADLWQALDQVRSSRTVTFEWVKGHAGHPENERADRLAVAAIPGGAAPVAQGTRSARSASLRAFPAKFPGVCRACGVRYPVGAPIARGAAEHRSEAWYGHKECVSANPVA